MRRQRICKTLAQHTLCIIHNTDTPALKGAQARKAHEAGADRRFGLVGSSRRAGLARSATLRSWLPGKHQQAFGKLRMGSQRVEKFGPLGGTPGVGHVACN